MHSGKHVRTQGIAGHTRSGGPEKLQLEAFCGSSLGPYIQPDLSRKQSVVDAERFFSAELAAFIGVGLVMKRSLASLL